MLRVLGLGTMVFILVALVPGDSRSYISGAFESGGLDLGDRHINPWTLEYMSFHFGGEWPFEIMAAFGRSFLLATLSALLSFSIFLIFFAVLTKKSEVALDVTSGLLLSLVSVLVSPVVAIVYLRFLGSGNNSAAVYFLAALSISFVAVGAYLKFLIAKHSQFEFRELGFGLSARGIDGAKLKWVHMAKLLSPDFLVLFFSRYAAYISGVFVAELVFNIRGLGWYFSQAFQSRSGLLLLILVLVSSLLYLLLNHLAILLAGRLDPRRQNEF